MAAQYGEYSVHGISSPGPFALRVTYAVSLAGNGCRGSGLLMVVSTRDHCLLTMGYPAVAE